MAGNDDLYSIDKVVDEFKQIRNPDMKHFEMDGGYEVVGLANANLTPWLCARDVDEQELTRKLDELAAMIHKPEQTIAILHVPPFGSSPEYKSMLTELAREAPRPSRIANAGELLKGQRPEVPVTEKMSPE